MGATRGIHGGPDAGSPAAPGRFPAAVGLALLLLLPPGVIAAEPQHLLGDGVQLRCRQASETRVDCRYRLLRPAVVEQLSVRVGEVALPAPSWNSFQQPPGRAAMLIMVDTSDLGRRAAIEKSGEHIKALLDAAGPQLDFGLATFDSELRIEAAIGSSRELIRTRTSALSAVDRPTELYRTALEAIRALDEGPGYPRALLIMSDGLAEDRAYFHHDVVTAARAAGVSVFAIGYPRSVPLSVGLQSLRRLAEETGGLYTDTGETFTLKQAFIGDALASLAGGGRLTVDLTTAIEAGLGGAQTLALEFALAGGPARVALPITLPASSAGETAFQEAGVPMPPAGGEATAPDEATASAEDPPERPAAPSVDTVWLWYVLLPGVLLVGLALFMLIALRTRQSELEDMISTGPSKAARSLAFLESQDGSRRRHAVTKSAFRIGRHSDNDLTIRDASISRQHAEIHRRRNGNFTITDLDSMNGVFVNQKKIDSVTLSDGDVIEIGDKTFRFRMRKQDESTDGETLGQSGIDTVTRLPSAAGE